MRTTTRKARTALAVLAGLLVAVGSTGSASAVTLNGAWAPFNRCPVDNPAMFTASTAENSIAYCSSVVSQRGTLTIGNLSASLGPSNTQLGLAGVDVVPIPPEGGAIEGSLARLPGGLTRLVCLKGLDVPGDTCKESRPERLNAVTLMVENAGVPSELALTAGFEVHVPIIAVPVKIHLKNPILGANCYIGSNANPIVMRPENISPLTLATDYFHPDGTPGEPEVGPMLRYLIGGSNQTDTTFAAPKATGCGVAGRLNAAINRNVGLPSPSGKNAIAFIDVVTYLAAQLFPPVNVGEELSAAWHAGVIG